MAIPVAHKRNPGNLNCWGHPIPLPPAPALLTEFEMRVRQLRLTPEMYTSSAELHTWCQQNRNQRYVPEWLLKEWGFTVDPGISADFAWSLMRGKRAERAA